MLCIIVTLSRCIVITMGKYLSVPSVFRHCWLGLGDRKGIRPVKTWFVGGDDLTGALHVL